ncbi:MAG: substrate-binding domain-containing protein [Pseudomonadota bacterium]
MPGHIARGAEWSIAFSNPQYIREIVENGRCARGVERLGFSPLAFAMRGTNCEAPTETTEGIARFILNCKEIAITEAGTSGAQFHRLLEALGIADEMRGRVRLMPGGGPMAALKGGDVDVAALPLTNIAPVEGVTARVFCPRALDVHIDLMFCLRAGVHPGAERLALWIRDAERRVTLEKLGLRPI